MKPNEADVRANVRKYCERYHIPPFTISELHVIGTLLRDTLQWPQGDSPGCYAIYCEQMGLLYVGKVSNAGAMAHRLSKHFRTQDLGRPEMQGSWPRMPHYVQTIKVHEAFEAPSLEEFLIRELNPPGNVI